MLSTPKNGWCLVSIGSWSDRGSYLDDIPVNLLRAVENVMLTEDPELVYFDAEGWEYIIEVDVDQTRITTETEDHEVEVRTFNVGAQDLARELINDVRRDLEGWVYWPPYADNPAFDDETRREMLITYCDIMEQLLPKNVS